MKVGRGITGTGVESMRPVAVDDARFTEQFAYFPQLAEERYPAFLAVPLLSGSRPRGALALQRETGPVPEEVLLLAVTASRALSALVEEQHPQGAHLLLHGAGNKRGRALGLATLLSRALPRRDPRRAPAEELSAAFAAGRAGGLPLAGRARAGPRGRRAGLGGGCGSPRPGRPAERAPAHPPPRPRPPLPLGTH